MEKNIVENRNQDQELQQIPITAIEAFIDMTVMGIIIFCVVSLLNWIV